MRTFALRTAFTAAVAALGMGAMSHQADAMDVGQCFDRAALQQKLQEEGQWPVAFANEPLDNQDKPEGRLFTSDAAGSVGYMIGGNQPREVGATRACVELRLKDVKVFDARVPGVDLGALIKTEDPATALRECEAIGRGTCDIHSRFLAAQDRDGYRVMMQAHIAELQPDKKTYATGDLVTLTGQMAGRKLGTWAVTSAAGAYTIARAYEDIAYAPYALKVLDDRKSAR